jgi:hypothetical protein
MSQNRQWIPLEEPITSYMDEAEISNHKYFKLWHIAYRALTELGLDTFFLVKSVKLPVNSNLTVTLPADYQMYSKVGVLNQQGEIIPMGVNNNLTVAFDLSPTRLEQTQDNTIPTQLDQQGVWWFNYWNGYGIGNLYGLPSGQPNIGSFKIDNANGVIVLSEGFSYEYVMLEYLSTPVPGQEYMIPIQFKEMRRRDYYNERRLAIARYDPINLPDLYQWNLLNQRLTVKG